MFSRTSLLLLCECMYTWLEIKMAEKYPSGEKEKGRGGYTYVCIFTYDVSVEISYTIHAHSSLLNVCMKRKAKCGLSLNPSTY